MTGEYFHNIDEKGRMFFPAKLREELGEVFFITKGLDNCLFVYSCESWKKLEERLAALPLAKGRNLQRFFLAGACECNPDSHGRINIPANLRQYASLEKEICVAGLTDRAEIWNADAWRSVNGSLCADPKQIAQDMDELGF